jgi:hypothetical protein
MVEIILTATQRKKIEELWFIYGNNGTKSNFNQHRFIQMILEEGLFDVNKKTQFFSKKAANVAKIIQPKSSYNNYIISDECYNEINDIINNK